MKKWEKDILERQMKNESVAVWQLEKVYNKAHQDSLEKLAMLKGMEPTPSVVRQVAFQEEITKQLSTVYDDLYKKSYTTIQGFLDTGAEDAFFGALYSMNKQGIPMAFPLPTEEIAQITRINPTTGFKLSEKLYANTTQLARKVKEEISRGLATDLSYQEMARNLKNASEANYKQAVRITRTEGHRVNGEVSFIAMDKAKKAGADIVKQWDSTLDKRTRKSHAEMDGQIRELEEKFVSGNGKKTMWQGGFGVANEDIHCRCVVLQRARWMLEADGEPPTKWDGVNKELIELKEQDYDGFKKAVKKLHPSKVKPKPIIPPKPEPEPIVEPIVEPDLSKMTRGERWEYQLEQERLEALKPQTFATKIAKIKKDAYGAYTKDDIMSAGEIFLKEIKDTPEMFKYTEKFKHMDDIVKDLSNKLDVQYADYKKAERKYKREIKKLRDDWQMPADEYGKKRDEWIGWLNEKGNTYNATRKEYMEKRAILGEIKTESFTPTSQVLKKKLAEIRPMGIADIDVDSHLFNSTDSAKDFVKDAYDLYPTEWVQKSVDYNKIMPSTESRGYYASYEKKIVVSGISDGNTFGTAVHELGHRFEDVISDIVYAEKQFYEYRTAGEDLKWMGMGYDKKEVTRVDNFVNKYMGKDYGGRAYELVSMGFQYAFTEPHNLLKDEEYAKWIYGILSLI